VTHPPTTQDLEIFRRFPRLASAIAHLPLAHLPTPVEQIDAGPRVWVKRDDLTSPRYGGNKVRKLEFLLGDARARGLTRLRTLGAIGSNHCLATAIHAADHGFDVHIRHFPQPVTPHVRHNLRALATTGAKLQLSPSPPAVPFGLAADWFADVVSGEFTCLIPAGGANVIGALGYVNAALELAAQVARNELPPPERIFVPLGTGGTVAGLVAGLRLSGIDTQVVGVRVIDGVPATSTLVAAQAQRVLRYLRSLDETVDEIDIRASDICVDHGQVGDGYGIPTSAGLRALEVMERCGLKGEPTYTAKAFAAMLRHLESGGTGPVLFWQTLSSVDLHERVKAGHPQKLPAPYHRFFQSGA
jgi:D-cysteine desulfhydrase